MHLREIVTGDDNYGEPVTKKGSAFLALPFFCRD